MTTWLELADTIRATGRIDQKMVDDIATARTEREIAELRLLGIPRTFDAEFIHQRTLAEQVAKTALDGELARRELAKVSPAERAARQCELRAELAETSIPPNEIKALFWRESARVCRQAALRPIPREAAE